MRTEDPAQELIRQGSPEGIKTSLAGSFVKQAGLKPGLEQCGILDDESSMRTEKGHCVFLMQN